MLNIILLEPEIPPNTGNIVRTCAALGAQLHLIEPLGFKLTDATIKRAGLDYWNMASVSTYKDLPTFLAQTGALPHIWFASTKAAKSYADITFPDPGWIMFGCETRGLPESLLSANFESCFRIPMRSGIRSLNLSNTVAIVAYEIMRQWNFPDLVQKGKLEFSEGTAL